MFDSKSIFSSIGNTANLVSPVSPVIGPGPKKPKKPKKLVVAPKPINKKTPPVPLTSEEPGYDYSKYKEKLQPSQYRPSIGDKDTSKYTYNPEVRAQFITNYIKKGGSAKFLHNFDDSEQWKESKGRDNKGEYISLYNHNTFTPSYYDRIYASDIEEAYKKIPQKTITVRSANGTRASYKTTNMNIGDLSLAQPLKVTTDAFNKNFPIDIKQKDIDGNDERHFKQYAVNRFRKYGENILNTKTIRPYFLLYNSKFRKSDTSNIVDIKDSDSPEAGFLRNGSFSEDSIRDIIAASKKFKRPAERIAAARAIESSGKVWANTYSNTHTLRNRVAQDKGLPVINPKKYSLKSLEQYVRQPDGTVNPEAFRKKVLSWEKKEEEFDKEMSKVENYSDAVAMYISKYGLKGVNPGQPKYVPLVEKAEKYLISKNIFKK